MVSLFGKKLNRSTRPDTLVEDWARSVRSGARGEFRRLFFGGSGYDNVPGLNTKDLAVCKTREFLCSFAGSTTPTADNNSRSAEHATTSLL